jgi:hypothetical protein
LECTAPLGAESRLTLLGVFGMARGALWRGFGLAMLVVGLAALSTMPLLQFAVFGYFLQSAARASEPRGWRHALVGVTAAAHVGVAAVCSLLWWAPVWILQDRAFAAALIVPDSPTALAAKRLAGGFGLFVILHLAASWLRGARLRDFLTPWASVWWLMRGLADPRRLSAAFRVAAVGIERTRLPMLFWLGLRAYLGSLLWVAIPAILLAAGPRHPLFGFVGAALLASILFRLPIMQVRFAQTGRMRAFAEWRAARELARRAPFAWTLAIAALVAVAVPLYAFKVEPLPNGFWWAASLFFVAVMLPAKLLCGWTLGVAQRRPQPAPRWRRWGMHSVAWPVAAIYVFWTFLTPYLGYKGVAQLIFEQHALLLPAPLGPFQ